MAIVGRTATRAESASTASISPPLPTDMQAGDFAVVHFAMSCSIANFTPPSGWTELVAPVATNNANRIVAVYGRFDPPSAPVGTSAAAADRQTAFCQAYGGVDTASPRDVAPSVGVVSTDPVNVPSITTVTAGARLISGVCADTSGHQYYPQPSMTLLGTHTNNVGRAAAWADEVLPTAGATGTRAWNSDTAGALSLRGYNVALRPATGAPAPTPVLNIAWVGAPTDDGFTVSTKTTDATLVRVKYGTDPTLATGAVFTTLLAPDSAGWRQHLVTGLDPGVDHYYAVEMTNGDSVVTLGAVRGPVRTLPAAGAGATTTRIAVGSCLSTADSAVTTAFDNLLTHDPDLFFHLGDFHYANSSATDAATHRGHLEAKIAGNSGLAAVLAKVPTVYIKSDHDAGGGNGALPGAYTAPNRSAHLQVVPHLPQVDPNALYHSFVIGRVRVIFTDDRYLRTTSRYLDEAQTTWLHDELTQPEPVKLWCQSGPWLIGDPAGDPAAGDDKWNDYPTEHEALGAWIAANAVGQVVTVHGDSHALEGDDGTNNLWGGFPVWCSAPFSNARVVRGGPYSQGTWPNTAADVDTTVGQQYSLIEITDDGADTITLGFSGRDTGDVERVAMTVTVDTSTAPPVSTVHVKGKTVTGVWRRSAGAAVAVTRTGRSVP